VENPTADIFADSACKRHITAGSGYRKSGAAITWTLVINRQYHPGRCRPQSAASSFSRVLEWHLLPAVGVPPSGEQKLFLPALFPHSVHFNLSTAVAVGTQSYSYRSARSLWPFTPTPRAWATWCFPRARLATVQVVSSEANNSNTLWRLPTAERSCRGKFILFEAEL